MLLTRSPQLALRSTTSRSAVAAPFGGRCLRRGVGRASPGPSIARPGRHSRLSEASAGADTHPARTRGLRHARGGLQRGRAGRPHQPGKWRLFRRSDPQPVGNAGPTNRHQIPQHPRCDPHRADHDHGQPPLALRTQDQLEYLQNRRLRGQSARKLRHNHQMLVCKQSGHSMRQIRSTSHLHWLESIHRPKSNVIGAVANFVEVDDAYLGGERAGGKRGRGAAGKTPIVAAVETTAERRPRRLRLSVVKGFRKKEVERLAERDFAAGSNVVSDGLSAGRRSRRPAASTSRWRPVPASGP